MKKIISLNGGISAIPIHDAKILSFEYDKNEFILKCKYGLYIENKKNDDTGYSIVFNIKSEDVTFIISEKKKSFLIKHTYCKLREFSLCDFQKNFSSWIPEIYEIYYSDSYCVVLKCAVIIDNEYVDKEIFIKVYISDDSVVEINY